MWNSLLYSLKKAVLDPTPTFESAIVLVSELHKNGEDVTFQPFWLLTVLCPQPHHRCILGGGKAVVITICNRLCHSHQLYHSPFFRSPTKYVMFFCQFLNPHPPDSIVSESVSYFPSNVYPSEMDGRKIHMSTLPVCRNTRDSIKVILGDFTAACLQAWKYFYTNLVWINSSFRFWLCKQIWRTMG